MREKAQGTMKRRLVLLGSALIIASVLSITYGTVILNQTVPATTDQVLNSICTTLTLSNPVTLVGSNGVELLTCGTPGTSPAFSSGTGSSTPTFALPTGYTSLRYLPDATNALTSCSGGGGAVLTTGSSVSFTPNNYDYCAIFSNVPPNGLSGFTISWAQ